MSSEDTNNGAQDNGVGNGIEVPEIELIIKVSALRLLPCMYFFLYLPRL